VLRIFIDQVKPMPAASSRWRMVCGEIRQPFAAADGDFRSIG